MLGAPGFAVILDFLALCVVGALDWSAPRRPSVLVACVVRPSAWCGFGLSVRGATDVVAAPTKVACVVIVQWLPRWLGRPSG